MDNELHTHPRRVGIRLRHERTLGELFPDPPLLRTMSSSNAESVTTAPIQDAHRVVAEEVAEDVIINAALRQGARKNSPRHAAHGAGVMGVRGGIVSDNFTTMQQTMNQRPALTRQAPQVTFRTPTRSLRWPRPPKFEIRKTWRFPRAPSIQRFSRLLR